VKNSEVHEKGKELIATMAGERSAKYRQEIQQVREFSILSEKAIVS